MSDSNVIPFAPPVLSVPTLGTTAAGVDVVIDVEKLLASRLFIQAMSGGGKSYALRRILEQTFGMVQQIVVDPEGELVTLAKEFGYIVCSPDSEEAPITPFSGAKVARAIFLSGRSAILNISDFEIEDAHEFVADFVRQLMKMPKEDWHHCIVAIDEVQLFCPQQDKAESKKPLIDLAGRGRKRGLCLVGATQRVSLVVKSVLASLETKMIGVTTLSNDVEKIADQLGMRFKDAQDVLKDLNIGEFLVYGAALSKSITKVKIGPVKTAHGSLARYSGVATPTLSREDLLIQIQASIMPEPTAREIAAALEPLSSNPRFDAIAPLVKHRKGSSAQIEARAEFLGVGKATLYRWIKQYRQSNKPESLLEGKRPSNSLIEVLRAEQAGEIVFEWGEDDSVRATKG